MQCDDFRDRFLDGAPLQGPLQEHLSACAGCREEFAFVGLLHADPPAPSGELRDRVLMSFPRRSRWKVLAWAASVLVAAATGFGAGALNHPAVTSTFTDEEIQVVVQGLREHYRDNVQFDMQDGRCRKIHIERRLLNMQCCETLREARHLAKERPDLVVVE